MKPKTKRVTFAVVLAAVVVGYALLLWRGPWWIDGAHLRTKSLQPADGVVITGFRTMLVAMGAGVVAGIGLWYTHQNHKLAQQQFEHTQEQFKLAQQQFEHSHEQFTHTQAKDRERSELTREGQVTDRYVEASKLLASERLTERLCGIYSFERIMHDSEKDRGTTIEVLAAFIRSKSAELKARREREARQEGSQAANSAISSEGIEKNSSKLGEQPDIPLLPEDIQAALTVLGRRPAPDKEQDISLRNAYIPRADLGGANLGNVNFAKAELTRANLRRAELGRANFFGANLKGANLEEAALVGTGLVQANLEGATFEGAVLKSALLWRASLPGANLRGANLEMALLEDADFHSAKGLTVEQLLPSILRRSTRLPSQLARDRQIHALLSDIETAKVAVNSDLATPRSSSDGTPTAGEPT
ncbi:MULTISPECIES: pentapeptide repeat-containing protein [unclassified Streptomyces]|uniref:pentapeptide repeat-containing protein n=1 Tax=unclassified Streptomyces TaxID=2593676 RepID=UPI00336A480D